MAKKRTTSKKTSKKKSTKVRAAKKPTKKRTTKRTTKATAAAKATTTASAGGKASTRTKKPSKSSAASAAAKATQQPGQTAAGAGAADAARQSRTAARAAQPGKSSLSTTSNGGASRSAAADEDQQGPPSEAQLRKVKTGLTRKDLNHYRRMLLEKRTELVGDVESLQIDSRNNGGNLSHMPVHMADVGSDNYEQEFTLGLVESERKLLREIDDALVRIGKGIYGVCVERGVPISRPRLDAKPWAKYCIEVAREMERRGQY